jgi:aspartyl-tRNA(Asn)/glutamyl-tRNA(Gln) amidotransferase subunit C
MPQALTKDDVRQIAALARLALSPAEEDLYARQLGDILGYARQICDIDTTGVPPTSHVLTRQPADRPDEPQPPLTRAEALANAPDAALEVGLFRVPRVIGG